MVVFGYGSELVVEGQDEVRREEEARPRATGVYSGREVPAGRD